MSRMAFDRIAGGLAEALAVAKGEREAARMHVPVEIDVRAIRDRTGLSQDRFAAAFGFTVHQVRQWEQGRHRPAGAMRAYLTAIDRAPETILGLLDASRSGREAA